LNLGSTTHNISKCNKLQFAGAPCIPGLRAERVPSLIESSFGSKLNEGVCFPRSNARSGLNQSSIMARKESEVSFQPVVWGVVTKASTLPALVGLEIQHVQFFGIPTRSKTKYHANWEVGASSICQLSRLIGVTLRG
jgi:hypothetical protein